MAQTIKLKRSGVQGAIPTTSQLELGEIALNTYDGKLYIKKDDGTESIVDVTSGGGPSTTDQLPEGSVNFYYTDERVDDRVNDLLQAGLGITVSYDDVNGELTIESDTIEENCKNGTASTILKGTPVYQTGTSGNFMEIAPADASNASKMPAVGVLAEDLIAEAEGTLLLMGRISGINTSAFSEGDVIYVASGGGYTNIRPTGESIYVQNLGRVTKVDSSNGGGVVMGSGRVNDIPNLGDGKVFIGNGVNAYEQRALVTADISDLTATATELNYTDGVTSNIQTQLDNKQPLSSILTNTTASFTTADETKLDGIEAGATADQTASEILTAIKTVDGTGSGLDADTLDGVQGSSYLRSDAYDIATGPIAWEGTLATFDPPGGGVGTDTATDVAIALGSGHKIAGWQNGYIRNLFGWSASSDIQIGQGGTTLIAGIDLLPGSSGTAKVNGNVIWHEGNDGTGSGLDADLLDGQQGSYYTGYTDTAIANLVASAPSTLDTLNELAAALGDDANFSTTVTNSIATKMPIAGGTFTGDVTFSTGAGFGSVVAFGGATDLSRHLALYSNTFGFSITSGNLNLVAGSTNTLSSTSSTLTSKVNHDFSAGIDVTGDITASGDITIEKPTGDVTLTVKTLYGSSYDAELLLAGARTASSTADIGRVRFRNETSSAYDLAMVSARDPSGAHGLGNGRLVFSTSSGGTLSEVMTIRETGNVGIGTSSPSQKLHVVGAVKIDNGATTALDLTNGDITGVNSLSFNDPGPNEGIFWGGGGSGWKIYESPNDLTTNSAGNLQFVLGSTRTLTLDTSGHGQFTGNLTIDGTLTVSGASGTINGNTIWHAGNDGTGSGLDADLLDGQQGSYYQPASSALTTSTTFGGDVSGTYNAIVVADDSHNHIISNVDGLQTALDAKADEANPSFAGKINLGNAYGIESYSIGLTSAGSGSTDDIYIGLLTTGVYEIAVYHEGHSGYNTVIYDLTVDYTSTNPTPAARVTRRARSTGAAEYGHVFGGTLQTNSSFHFWFRFTHTAPSGNTLSMRVVVIKKSGVATWTRPTAPTTPDYATTQYLPVVDVYNSNQQVTFSGNVGIGTTNPLQKLDVNGTVNVGDGNNRLNISASGSGALLNNIDNSSLQFGTSNTTRVTINSSGFVGINTTSPKEHLHVNGEIVQNGDQFLGGNLYYASGWKFLDSSGYGTILRLADSNNDLVMFGSDAASTAADSTATLHTLLAYELDNKVWKFLTNNTERMRINSDGNVGIGTSSPNSPLNIVAGATLTETTIGGRTIDTGGVTVAATSGRAGFISHVPNNFVAVNNNAGFQHLYPFTDTRDCYAFRASIGSTLSDTFWVKQRGDAYFSGNVGIGTSSPTARLNIVDATSQDALRITQTGTGNALVVEDSANPDSTPLVVNSAGELVVGSTTNVLFSSAFRPQIQSLSTGSGSSIGIGRFSTASAGALTFLRSRGALGAFDIVQSNDMIGQITFNAADGTEGILGAGIYAHVDGTPGAGDMPGRLTFATTADGASSPTERMRIDSAGRVGIGSTPSAGRALTISSDITGSTSSICLRQDSTIKSDVTSAAYFNYTSPSTEAASFNLGTLVHYFSNQGSIGSGSSVTSQYGFYANSNLTGATNNYGFYGNIGAGTGRWNLYMAGSANNYLAGRLGIGTTTVADNTLRIALSMTSATSVSAVNNVGIIQSDVTTAANYYRTSAYTAAGSYTVASLRHFIAEEGSFGAGSTVTNQYAFYAHNNLTGATNNYGFYGDIAFGTGRYNLYMNGTANNYMAGKTIIGNTNHTDTALLTLNGTSGANVVSISRWYNDTAPPRIYVNKSRNNTPGSHTIVNNGDTIMGIYAKGSDGTQFLTAADISVFVDGTPGTNDMPGRLVFSTTADGASSPTERMRITSAGSVGIGTTNPTSTLTVGGDTEVTGKLSSIGNFAVGTTPGNDYQAMIYSNSGGNQLFIDQNGSSGTPLRIDNSGSSYGIVLNQYGDANAVYIEAANTDSPGISGRFTSLTTASGLYIYSTSNSTSSRSIIDFQQTSGFATNATVLKLTQASSADALFIDMNGNGNAIYVDGGDVQINNGDIIVTGTVDGRDVAADGTKLDGIEAGATADQTASEILTAIKTVDGSGSGLDADLWDGNQFATYLNQPVLIGSPVTFGRISIGTNTYNTTTDLKFADNAVLGTDISFHHVVEGTNNHIWYNGSTDASAGISGATERMRLDGSGNLGIGTSSPTARLNIVDATSQDALRITQTGSGNALLVEDSANPDSTPFFIDAAGRVGIGLLPSNVVTANGGRIPNLQYVVSSATAHCMLIGNYYNALNYGGAIDFVTSRSGTAGVAGGIVSANDSIGNLRFYADDGAKTVLAAYISGTVDGTPGTDDMPGRLTFATTADGASSPTERMRIDSEGKIGINITPSTGQQVVLSGVGVGGAASCYGLLNRAPIQPTVTASASLYHTWATTAANGGVPYTINSLSHYSCQQIPLHADSSVSTQVGFYVDTTLTGATTNYSFRGRTPAGTGRWNIYMDGTANNYLAGNVGIGVTSPSEKLDVSGKIQASETIVALGGGTYVNGDSQTDVAIAVPTGKFIKSKHGTSNIRTMIGHDGTGIIIGQNNTSLIGYTVVRSGVSGYTSFENGNSEKMRITSDGIVTLTNGNLQVGSSSISTADTKIEIGGSRTGNGSSYIDLIGDTTYTDYGLRLIRGNGGANASSTLTHRGTGLLQLTTEDAASIALKTTNTERMRIDSAGNVGIGTSSPTNKLHILGSSNDTINSTNLNVKFQGGGGNGLGFGTIASSPYTSYIQSGYVTDFSLATYNLALNPNGGNVGIGTTSPSYKLEVNGSFAATTKSFVIDHPTKPGMKLRHGSLEGPENGVYVRGKSTEGVIELPDYWVGLIHEDSITVQLTPIGGMQELFVKEIKDNKVYVVGSNYFYYVQAERKDVEKFEVEY